MWREMHGNKDAQRKQSDRYKGGLNEGKSYIMKFPGIYYPVSLAINAPLGRVSTISSLALGLSTVIISIHQLNCHFLKVHL